MITKNEFPILEYSTEEKGILDAKEAYDYKNADFPKLCFMPFFGEVFEEYAKKYGCGEKEIGGYNSEIGDFPVLKISYKSKEMCMMRAPVGSSGAASFADYLYSNGVETIICCGGCGVLDDIPRGDVIVPVKALRGEGSSYQYLPPSRFVGLSDNVIEKIEAVLNRLKVPYIKSITWTTDGLFRETKEMVEYRRSEGCKTVEMECAAFAAVAKFKGKSFGQLLYSGDVVTGEGNYDDREWYNDMSARERLAHIAIETLYTL
ncbi:MAG: nucleoside phosphorylase [Bacteroides sp.]|nr:nucleoside phosphorylase [Bacteroides sp.]